MRTTIHRRRWIVDRTLNPLATRNRSRPSTGAAELLHDIHQAAGQQRAIMPFAQPLGEIS
jgi:hypothetical protein